MNVLRHCIIQQLQSELHEQQCIARLLLLQQDYSASQQYYPKSHVNLFIVLNNQQQLTQLGCVTWLDKLM